MGSAMSLIVLTAICFLACAFYVYVLIHWMRDTKRKKATHSAGENLADENREPKRPHIIGSRRAPESHGRFAARSLRHASMAGRARGSAPACHQVEHNAYETIARAWSSGRRI